MTNCRYVRVISPDIPSKTVASLHTVGQGCRVPLLVNWELKLKIEHVIKTLRNRGCPHTHTHTHPHRSRQGDVLAHEVKVRMKRGWDESEDEMRLLNRDTRRGTQKKREGANTNTNTPGRKRANPERAREEKTEADGNRNGARPAKKGRMEAPEPTYHSETYAYLARTGPNLPGEGRTHEIGDRMGN